MTKLREHRLVGQLHFMLDGLGQAKVDYLGNWLPVIKSHQHIGWFDIAMNDSFLVCMLDRLTDRDKQFESFIWRELVGRNIA